MFCKFDMKVTDRIYAATERDAGAVDQVPRLHQHAVDVKRVLVRNQQVTLGYVVGKCAGADPDRRQVGVRGREGTGVGELRWPIHLIGFASPESVITRSPIASSSTARSPCIGEDARAGEEAGRIVVLREHCLKRRRIGKRGVSTLRSPTVRVVECWCRRQRGPLGQNLLLLTGGRQSVSRVAAAAESLVDGNDLIERPAYVERLLHCGVVTPRSMPPENWGADRVGIQPNQIGTGVARCDGVGRASGDPSSSATMNEIFAGACWAM